MTSAKAALSIARRLREAIKIKIFGDKNVYEAAIERLNFLFDEFDDISVAVSGGKDSTIALFMTLEVARARGRGINMFFLDQEFEWQGSVDLIREWTKIEGVTTYWLQAPLIMYNSNSALVPYVEIWGEERKDEWMREKEPNSMHVRFSPKVRFNETASEYVKWRRDVTGGKACTITGMRAEESLNRFRGTTGGLTYGDKTWGRKDGENAYTFHPFYDWTFRDVWKYICDNEIKYNPVYDQMYQLGVPITNMRVSNLIHEYTTALLYLQEIEPKTYERLTVALPGIGTRAKFAEDFIPKKLPDTFTTWKEYRDYLVETIVAPEYRDGFKKVWMKQADHDDIHRMQCIECIKSDVTHTINRDKTNNISYKVGKARKARAKEQKKHERKDKTS